MYPIPTPTTHTHTHNTLDSFIDYYLSMRQDASIRHISRCTIKPECMINEESQQIYYLTAWDLAMLSVDYIQNGLLFIKPPPTSQDQDPMTTIADQLKDSLSRTLTHFPPLTGHLVTKKGVDPPSYSVLLDCSDPTGAEFIHAIADDVTVADILTPIDVPPFVESLFAIHKEINHDAHTIPVLAIQMTELVDGIFIGCSINHSIADGTSFWHFFNTWSEISRTTKENIMCISRPPITKRWFPDGHGPIINLPFSHHDEFIEKYEPPPLRQRIFHFSSQSIAQLKKKANAECNTDRISSFQALVALLWRSVTRARHLPADQKTSCRLAMDNRSRLDPPLSRDYFGNCLQAVCGTTTAGELLSHGLGWSAWLLHEAVVGQTDRKVHEWLEAWLKAPSIYHLERFFDRFSVMVGNSPRFDMYNNDFGWGKVLAVRCGYGNKYDGKVSSYPGREGGGSVDLEVSLPHQSMNALELDEEFMGAVSSLNPSV